MNITIKEKDHRLVTFESRIGTGAANWYGTCPEVGEEYEVELDIDDRFEWGKNIHPSRENHQKLGLRDTTLEFVANVLSYEEDGVLTLSLDGGVLLLEASVPPDNSLNFVYFFTPSDKVTLYPVAY
ncbi:MAG: hypothetical protein LBQ75_03970 [Zoogloeaceae bacterium]|jgi:hypothetical protein|nr:hypothetical protein [Zoogloeaceae bacterium]